ncbi:MAG TPA: tetratricopeptide repeat protein, partial [Gemmatimonadales bacterium]|nr:tetratricopeptide repeat protein [Gemmatimonadales bacterium]
DPAEKKSINERPTTNTDAYDFYLRGIEYDSRGPAREDVHNSVEMFRRATELDSNFAQAWARFSIGRSGEYWFFYDRSEAALSEAKAAADRALRLRPDLPEPHVALGYYYYWAKLDYDRALKEFALAQERQPNNGDLFLAIASVDRRQGRWAQAVVDFQKTAQLSPRSIDAVGNLSQTYSLVRKYDLACAIADRAIGIGPDVAFPRWLKLQCLMGEDSLPQARAAAREALKAVGLVQMVGEAPGVGAIGSFAVVPSFLLLEDSAYQPKVEQLTVADLPDTLGLYRLKADMYRIQGRVKLEQAYLDSARAVLEPKVKTHPDEANFRALLGLVYARLGRKTEAVREGQTAVKLLPVSREAYRGANMQTALALIYATVGMRPKALEQLKYLLSIPCDISRGLLRHDPRWAGLRDDPKFQELIR